MWVQVFPDANSRFRSVKTSLQLHMMLRFQSDVSKTHAPCCTWNEENADAQTREKFGLCSAGNTLVEGRYSFKKSMRPISSYPLAADQCSGLGADVVLLLWLVPS